MATAGVDKKVLERRKYGRVTRAALTVRNRTFNFSLEAKTEPTTVLDQSLVEHLQFYGETKRADSRSSLKCDRCMYCGGLWWSAEDQVGLIQYYKRQHI